MFVVAVPAHLGQIDHDLDHPDPNLPFRGAVQGLYSTDPTQETCPTVQVGDADYVTPTRQRKLAHTDQGSMCPERSRSSSGNRVSVGGVQVPRPAQTVY